MGYKTLAVFRVAGRKFKRNVFPASLLVIFVVLTVFGISGSSMAAFDQEVTGKASGVIAGHPRLIRSDEWLWQSQQLLVQRADHYPAVNKNIGIGEDMSMVLDVPFRSFFTIFKPQNLFFFILPYNQAFAARWWFMALVLGLGFYFLMNRLLPNRRLLISLGALLLLFNPFTQWWYQSMTLLGIGYGLWACFFVLKMFDKNEDIKRLALYGLGLAYASLSFIFLLYPPFLLPVAYVVIALLAGFFYHRYFVLRLSVLADKLRWLSVAAALLLVAIVSLTFFFTHRQVIHTIESTGYPGVRNIVSGQSGAKEGTGFNILDTFSSPILLNLQNDKKAGHFYANQSEAARIVAINLFILPVVFYQITKKTRKSRKLIDYLLLSTSTLGVIFMVRLFTPLFNLPFKLLLFNKVPNQRLAMGLVLLCVVQLVLLGITAVGKLDVKKAATVAVVAFAVLFDSSVEIVHSNHGFMSTMGVLIACLIVSVSLFLMLQKRSFVWGLALFLVFNVASSIAINPIYDRSESLAMQSLAGQISSRYTDTKSWVVLDSTIFEHVPLVAGKQAFTGVQYYPQLGLWHNIDPSSQARLAYNRYAHVIFTDYKLPGGVTFYSPADDQLLVNFSCGVAAKLPNFGYVLSPSAVDTRSLSCLKSDGTMKYPSVTFRVYKYVPPPSQRTL